MYTVDEIKSEISAAFDGVELDGGISLNQTKVIDNYGRDCSSEQFAALPMGEVTDDWRKIPNSVSMKPTVQLILIKKVSGITFLP